jgi:hypothetical protein
MALFLGRCSGEKIWLLVGWWRSMVFLNYIRIHMTESFSDVSNKMTKNHLTTTTKDVPMTHNERYASFHDTHSFSFSGQDASNLLIRPFSAVNSSKITHPNTTVASTNIGMEWIRRGPTFVRPNLSYLIVYLEHHNKLYPHESSRTKLDNLHTTIMTDQQGTQTRINSAFSLSQQEKPLFDIPSSSSRSSLVCVRWQRGLVLFPFSPCAENFFTGVACVDDVSSSDDDTQPNHTVKWHFDWVQRI